MASPEMTSASTPIPFAVDQSSFFDDGFGPLSTKAGFRCFGDTINQPYAWAAINGVVVAFGWVRFDWGPGAAVLLASYSIKNMGGADYVFFPNRSPNSWVVEGSNDTVTWDLLDTVTGQTGWGSEEVRTFQCDVAVPLPYRYFRLFVTLNNGATDYTEVNKWDMGGTANRFY
jgi:hypothetical protein